METNPQTTHTPVRRVQRTGDEYVAGVLACDPALLGRTMTLIESRNAAHRDMAQEVLERLLPSTGKAHRLGITGAPGVGKSTFIEALGCHLTAAGQRVAVLAVDPTSSHTGGSILGDKTRLQEKRQQQQLRWMWAMLEERLLTTRRTQPRVLALLPETEQAVLCNQSTPTLAVERLLRAFGHCYSP